MPHLVLVRQLPLLPDIASRVLRISGGGVLAIGAISLAQAAAAFQAE